VFLKHPTPVVSPKKYSDGNAFTYLVTPKFKISDDLMVYARLASGYRPGGGAKGSAGSPCVVFNFPCEYKADTTQNYEVGIKGDFIGHTLSVDASVYRINWRDIQLTVLDPNTQGDYTANGSRAKSEGVELSVESKPLTGLTVGITAAFDNAVMTETFPQHSTLVGGTGDRLPNSARVSGTLSLRQSFPLTSRITGFVGGTESYVGDRVGLFTGPPGKRANFPGYARTDLYAGAEYESWTVSFFVTNALDKRGVLTGGLDLLPTYAYNYIQPRTVGLNISKPF
jgi:outer membrane receptor protein involved in Fe transport